MSYARPFPTGPRRPESSGDDRPGRPTHQRQMTASSGRTPPPPAPLGLPEPTPPPSTRSSRSRARSKSPLRNSFSSNATNSEEDHFTDAASSTPVSVHGHGAPNPAVNRLSAFLRAGSSFIGSSASSVSENRPAPQRASTLPQSPGGSVLSRLTDAELEAQAMREKENSRLEAERILMMEADQRRKDEERVLTILRTDVARANVPPLPGSPRNAASPKLLPLTPAADVSAPTTPRKEDSGNWMSGLVKKLTPTKDLTPAQQIINETKAREKEIEKEKKRAAKGHRGWPSTSDAKLADPAFLSLAQAATPSTPTVSPSSRLTPSNYSPLASGSPRVGGHPMINGFSPSTPTPPQRTHGPPGGSPVLAPASGESTPLYALFNQEGTLDVPATLITIARRFEKLEKWTVSHVRALEERMKDVEKYLIDRESQDKTDGTARKDLESINKELSSIRSALLDLRSDMDTMKKEQTAEKVVAEKTRERPVERIIERSDPFIVNGLSSGSSSSKFDPEIALAGTSIPQPKPVRPNLTGGTNLSSSSPSMRSLPQPPGPSTASPSVFSGRSNGTNGNANGTGTPEPKPASGEVRTPANKPSRSRLPYPSGDYTSPDDGFSPSSRPGSPSYDSPSVSMTSSFTMAGTHSQDRSGSDGSYVIPQRVRSPSPPVSNRNSTASTDLAPPKTPVANRASSKSPSPTPRKRYTVALSGREDLPSPNTATRGEGEVQTALFSDSPNGSRTQSPIEAAERFTFGFGGLVNGHGKESSDSTDATAAPPEREQNTSPEPTIGNTAIILSRLSSSPPPTKPGSGSPKPMGRPRSLYSIQSISPSLKTVSSSTTTNTTQTSPRTPSFRARAQSAFQPLDSVSATLHNASTPTTPAPSERRVGRKPVPEEGKKTHRRSQSIGHGLGITTRDLEAEPSEGSPRSAITASSYVTSSSVVTSAVTGTSVTGTSVGVRTQALVTPSGAPFVDPLVIRKKTKDVPPTPVAVKNVPGGKIPFGQLLAFFDGEKQ